MAVSFYPGMILNISEKQYLVKEVRGPDEYMPFKLTIMIEEVAPDV